MISIGSTRDTQKVLELLAQPHSYGAIVELKDLSHNAKGDLSDFLIGGQVNIDATAEVTRSATVELLDPLRRLRLDSEAPEDGSMYFTKMIKITIVVASIDRSEVYFIPVFCGPLNKVDRSGPILTVEAQGKESLLFNTFWSAKTYKKGAKKTDVLKAILDAGGEAADKMDIPDLNARLRTNLSANRKFTFWNRARKVSQGMARQLFYDGRGQARFRKIPNKVTYTFQDDATILTNPQVTYDAQSIFNAVEVIGGKPKGKKKKVHVKVVAPKSHPLSPWNIGRNNVPRFIPMVVEDDSIKSTKEARRVARRHLKNSLAESIEVTFDSLPIPLLEELDLCRFKTEDLAGDFRIRQMTIPLTADGVSTIGYLRRVTPRRLGNRNHRSHRRGKGRR